MQLDFKDISEIDIQLIAENFYSEIKKFCIQYKSAISEKEQNLVSNKECKGEKGELK